MQIIDEVFSTREDPDQLQVDEQVIARLNELHPATLTQLNAEDEIAQSLRIPNSTLPTTGPAIWILIIPTIRGLMEKFLSGEISEQEMFDATKPGMKFDCIYLCSATVLPEYRRKGLAMKMTVDAVRKVMEDFEIKTLFVWPFSEGGEGLARRIAGEVELDLRVKK